MFELLIIIAIIYLVLGVILFAVAFTVGGLIDCFERTLSFGYLCLWFAIFVISVTVWPYFTYYMLIKVDEDWV